MKKRLFIFILILMLFGLFSNFFIVSGENKNSTKVYYFWGEGCSHCKNVLSSGVLEEVEKIDGVKIDKREVYFNQENRNLYFNFVERLQVPQIQRGIPFLVIECNEKSFYFIGDKPIIEHLKESVLKCEVENKLSSDFSSDSPHTEKLTLWSIIFAALIDSINPCAFGVLIFLMATLLSLSSHKRALKYGLVYIFIVFLVYFLAGIGIIRFLTSNSNLTYYFVFISAILVFIGAVLEIKDFFFYGKGFSLKIPSSAKPLIEKLTNKGTLIAVVCLGFLVALVELPCTGGIYLAILSLMAVNKTFGISYLFLYNLVFILPLFLMVLLVYFGTKTEKISKWISKEKRFMRLAAGILMLLLSFYLFNSLFNFINFSNL